MVSLYSSLVGAVLVALTTSTASASGVCYSPWHHPGAVNMDILKKDFSIVKQYFPSIRTYHARFSGVNAIDAAAAGGLKVAVGVNMQNPNDIQNEINAVCEGAKRHPSTVEAVYVGNENLRNKGFGQFSGGQLIDYIKKVKGCVPKGIPVGTVQRVNEWLEAGDAKQLADNCDVIGVNIHPFFAPGPRKPVEKLDDQYQQIVKKGYPANKIHVTETGWPRGGGSSNGNNGNVAQSQQFVNDYFQWIKGKPTPYYFMMFDTVNAYGGGEYEKFFGLGNKDNQMILKIPSGHARAYKPNTNSTASSNQTAPSNQTTHKHHKHHKHQNKTRSPKPTTVVPTTVVPTTVPTATNKTTPSLRV